MLANLSRLLIHLLGAALACAQLAYWSIRLMTPPPAAAPAPLRALAVRDPDPVLLGRAFGQLERPAASAIGNIQVAGVFAAGRDSAAVFVVGDRPARAVRLGQEVAPGSTLVQVDPQGVTLESGGVKRQLRVPSVALAGTTAPGAVRGASFERRGNVLTAPMMDVPPTTHATAGRSPAGVMAARPEPRPETLPGAPGRREMIGTPTRQ